MIYAWIGATLVGLCLGLLGSGGAILTVPLLVYVVGHGDKQAIAEGLLIVGVIAAAGAIRAWVAGKFSASSAVLFGLPGMAGALVGAFLARFVPGAVQLAALAVVMLVVAWMMFRGGAAVSGGPVRGGRATGLAAGQGFGVGVLTGVLGVGGGFLIVPMLVLLGGLPMGLAIGTSLGIIAMNCAAGFAKSWSSLEGDGMEIDWATCGVFAVLGIVGTLVGGSIGGRLNQARLRRLFAVFLVLMAAYVLWREVPRVFAGSGEAAPGGVEAAGRRMKNPGLGAGVGWAS